MPIAKENFNAVYYGLLHKILAEGETSVNRKGMTLRALHNQVFAIKDPMKCIAILRTPSMEYLEREFAFYLSGSDSVVEAGKLSPVWKKCTDDGETINSNYGKLLFHDRNKEGYTQFEHMVNCLKNNPQSKKAVGTLYDKENAYISNDNPCTMFVQARIDNDNRLHFSTFMRSNDIYYGAPYDVPWFAFVQYALVRELREVYPKINLGTYTHTACSSHQYESKTKVVQEALESVNIGSLLDYPSGALTFICELFEKSYAKVKNLEQLELDREIMDLAWKASERSTCLKKKVGGVLARGSNMLEARCGSPEVACKTCARDDEKDSYFGDECPSVHAEMNCIVKALQHGEKDLSDCTMYTTHGPCDACLKLCDLVGIKRVVYEKEYKTNYKHWPRIGVVKLKR